MHKILLLHKIPDFSKYLCDSCDNHSETVLILPDVAKSDLEKEVKALYSLGIVSGLEAGLGFRKGGDASEHNDNQAHELEYNEKNKTAHAKITANDESSEDAIKEVVTTEEALDLGAKADEVVGDNNIIAKDDIKVEDELQEHSFEILTSKRGNSTSPGILFVDNQFKYYCRDERDGKFRYRCALRRTENCQATATAQRDASTGQLVIVKCASDDAHTHEGSKE